MGSGPSSAKRSQLATKVQVVVALTPKRRVPCQSRDEATSKSKESANASDFVTRYLLMQSCNLMVLSAVFAIL